MEKLLLTWDIKLGNHERHLEFVQKLVNDMVEVGLRPLELWLTTYGRGPRVILGAVAHNGDSVESIVNSSAWKRLQAGLDEHADNLTLRIVPGDNYSVVLPS